MGRFSGMLLVTDFDDSFRPCGEQDVPRANLDAAAEFMAEGGMFTIATGRSVRSFLNICRRFTINAPAILSNGVVLFDGETRESVYESFLPFSCRADMKKVLAAFPELGMEVHRGADVCVCVPSANVEKHVREMNAPLRCADMDRVMFPWTTAVLIAPGALDADAPMAHDVADFLVREFPGLYDAAPAGAIVDVAAAGNTKGTGVRRLAELLDIAPENVICVGDGWNDIPMLRAAGRAFVPANAYPGVRAEPGVTVVGECRRALRDVVDALK